VQITILPTLQWADLFFASGSIYLFTFVGITSDPYDALMSPHSKHKRETMSKRPPIAGGKIALASQRKKSRQLLESEQQQVRDHVDLLLLVDRNSLLAASVAPGMPSGRDKRYAARIASAEKGRRSIDLTAICANSYVVEKLCSIAMEVSLKCRKLPSLLRGGEESNPIAELAEGEEDGEEDDDGSSGVIRIICQWQRDKGGGGGQGTCPQSCPSSPSRQGQA
jgi:hypothetical protein